ncbi:beta-ketoacyl-ACP synthase III [Actinomadura rupiterrae]|uniref:beta-ketoacyl-ACP synthase III n=1 Tax=Actinomadura rupiterrae TaxID=559627 RepID=UPI0020A5BDD1|nr:beta-ketoacyl-ACP synthase III [Actinomadura rupiterrae]MCP2335721.1 3-oxoacyl-[acyl-carrier-protein] synthase-3 [Actinomadura rupiterrae]
MTGVTLRAEPVRPGARVLGFGGHQPAKVVTNHDFAAVMDTSDEWIRSRVGIVERRLAGPDETITDLAVQAGGKALAASGLAPSDVDLVIVATCSAETPMPSHAPAVAHRLGIEAPGAYDLNSACSGFCYALAAADAAVRTGSARNVLVVGAEKMSQWIDQTDRSTAIIFADGAGAAVVGPSETPGIGPVVWGSDGSAPERIAIADRTSFIRQDGQAVFRWATTAIAPVALAAVERAGLVPDDLATIVPHQANLRIIDAIARRIKATNAVVADDITRSGNTSGASIPLALAHMIERGDVPSGAPALLVGFGAGLSYAAQVIQIP